MRRASPASSIVVAVAGAGGKRAPAGFHLAGPPSLREPCHGAADGPGPERPGAAASASRALAEGESLIHSIAWFAFHSPGAAEQVGAVWTSLGIYKAERLAVKPTQRAEGMFYKVRRQLGT